MSPSNVVSKLRGKSTVVAVSFLVATALLLSGIYVVGKQQTKKTAFASNYQQDTANGIANDLSSALTENVASSILSSSIEDYLGNEQLQNLITQKVSEYVSDDNSEQMSQAVQNALTSSVASQMDALSAEQRNEILQLVNHVVENKLSGLKADKMSDELIAQTVDEVKAELASSAELADIVKQMKIDTGKLDVTEVLERMNIASIVATNQTKQYSAEDIDAISKILTDRVSELLGQVMNSIGGTTVTTNTTTPVAGTNGTNGTDGKNGANGVDGKDGKDGVNGTDGYTPTKGVDYFTDEDIANIVAKSSESATRSLSNNLQKVNSQISTLDTKIEAMSTSVDKLENIVTTSAGTTNASTGTTGTNEVSPELLKQLNEVFATVNNLSTSVSDIYESIDFTDVKLSLAEVKNGAITKAQPVATADMSVSDALKLLSANDKAYTTAINQLWYVIEQLKTNVGGEYEQLDALIAGLESNLVGEDGKVQDIFNIIALYKEDLLRKRQEIINVVNQNQNNVNDKVTALLAALDSGDGVAIDKAKEDLKQAINSYNTYLQENYNALSQDQREIVDNIYQYIQNIAGGLDDTNISAEELSKLLNQNSNDLNQSSNLLKHFIDGSVRDLQQQIDSLKNEILDSSTNGESSAIQEHIATLTNYKQVIHEYSEELQTIINTFNECVKNGDTAGADAAKVEIQNVIQRYIEYLQTVEGSSETMEQVNNLIQYLQSINQTVTDEGKTNEEISTALGDSVTNITEYMNNVLGAVDHQIKDYDAQLGVLVSDSAELNRALQSMRADVDKEVNARIAAMEKLKEQLQAYQDKLSTIEGKIESGAGSSGSGSTTGPGSDVYVTLTQLENTLVENSAYLESYSNDLYSQLLADVEAAMGEISSDTSDSIDGIRNNIVNINSTLEQTTTNLQTGVDDLYSSVALLQEATTNEALNRAANDDALKDLIGETVADYNQKISDLKYAILDGNTGVISQTKEELVGLCDELQQQLTNSVDSLSDDMQNEVSAIIQDLVNTKTSLSQNMYQTTNELINTINNENALADTWCYDVTLSSATEGSTSYANNKSIISPTKASPEEGYEWIVTGATGLNIKDISDVQVFYNKETIGNVTNWGTQIEYKCNNGSIIISVPAAYYKTVKGDLKIDMFHVTNPIVQINNIEEPE